MTARDDTPPASHSIPPESLNFGRTPALDSVRAIGALAVGIWHLYITLPHDTQMRNIWFLWSPIRLLNPAVVIFYLLSGFVLAFPYLKGTQPSYRQFFVARMSRLYIPFAVILAVAFLS